MNPLQDSLHWTRRHQLVWPGISVLGAVLGMMLEFIHSPFFSLTPTGGRSLRGYRFLSRIGRGQYLAFSLLQQLFMRPSFSEAPIRGLPVSSAKMGIPRK